MTIKVEGGRELRKAFNDLGGKAAKKRLGEAYREVSVRAAMDAQTAARSGSAFQAKMASAIRPQASTTRAGVAISRTGQHKAAGAAFYGTKNRLGWFAAPKFGSYTAATQKLPEWVGNTWTAATPGQGPHRINDAMAANVPRYVEILGDGMERAAHDVGLTMTK